LTVAELFGNFTTNVTWVGKVVVDDLGLRESGSRLRDRRTNPNEPPPKPLLDADGKPQREMTNFEKIQRALHKLRDFWYAYSEGYSGELGEAAANLLDKGNWIAGLLKVNGNCCSDSRRPSLCNSYRPF
jgi:hypothetical protein